MVIYLKKSVVDEVMSKAMWTTNGKHKEKVADKNGHMVTRWIANKEAENEKQKKAAEEDEKNGSKDPIDIENLRASKKVNKLGDMVTIIDKDGKEQNGQVVSVGHDGVTIKDGGVVYQALFKNIKRNITREGSENPENFNGADYAKKFMDYKISELEKSKKGAGVDYFLKNYLPGAEGQEMGEKCNEYEQRVKDQIATEGETISRYRLSGEGVDAKYSKERSESVHKKVYEEYLSPEKIRKATPPAGEKPQLVILGGRAGAGKSWFTYEGQGGIYEEDMKAGKYIILDADTIKSFIPEYQGWNAGTVHEESSDLNKKLIKMCMDLGVNVIIDGTMASPKKAVAQVMDFKAAGYKTSCDYMFTPMQESMKRACGRFKTRSGDYSGRFVPLGIMTGMTANEDSFEAVKNIVDRYSFRDNYNQTNGQPTLICQKGNY